MSCCPVLCSAVVVAGLESLPAQDITWIMEELSQAWPLLGDPVNPKDKILTSGLYDKLKDAGFENYMRVSTAKTQVQDSGVREWFLGPGPLFVSARQNCGRQLSNFRLQTCVKICWLQAPHACKFLLVAGQWSCDCVGLLTYAMLTVACCCCCFCAGVAADTQCGTLSHQHTHESHQQQ